MNLNEHKKTLEFWENIKDYEKEIVSVFKNDNILIEELKNIKNKEKKSILDLGCGSGNSFKYIKDFKEIHVIDYSENMLNIAKNNNYKNIIYHKKNLLDFNLNLKFDVIIAIMSIFPQDYTEFTKIIENIKKHLKKKSVLYIVVQSFETATLYFQILSKNMFEKGEKPEIILNKINQEVKNRNYNPFGYLKTTNNIVQKYWLKEELEYRLKYENNLKIIFTKKLELDWKTQFKFEKDLSKQKLWYWFLKINNQ